MSRVAVIGGGATGTLVAVQLARAGAKVTLIERAAQVGRGLAYGTMQPEHLLNVPAARMSALPDDPDHFARWWSAGGGTPEGFAPRMIYGTYLQDLLASVPVEVVRDEAVDVTADEAGERVHLRSGAVLDAHHVVLAPGNLPPVPLRADLPPQRLGDPWSENLAAGLGPDDLVLLVGTGLTAVDAVLTLDAPGFQGRILAVSRRGLHPRGHAPLAPVPPAPAGLPTALPALSRAVRADAAARGWRAAVDRLRPLTTLLWAQADDAARARFLRHLRPWWDVHRHRIAPDVSARLDTLQAEGRLQIAGGRILSLSEQDGAADLRWRPRGQADVQAVKVARVVNCTGPGFDIARAGDPLLTRLLAAGRIRQDSLKLGLDTDADGRVRDAAGTLSPTLTAAGPVTRSALWEIVAVPDIRVQAQAIAARIAG